MLNLSKKTFNDLHLALSFTVLLTTYNAQSHVQYLANGQQQLCWTVPILIELGKCTRGLLESYIKCYTKVLSVYNRDNKSLTRSFCDSQQTLTVSIQHDNPEYNANGFVSLGIVFSFFTFGMWLASSSIALIGWKASSVFGSMCFMPLVTFGYFENIWLTYAGGAITGFGAALLWTSQATYCVLNSEIGDVYNTFSVFWMICEASEFTGNLFVYCLFKDPDQPIDRSMRNKISIVLAGFVLCAALMLANLRQPIRPQHRDEKGTTVCLEIKKAFRLLISKQMIISSVIFIFCGLNVSFLSVLPASLGFARYLSSNSKEYAPLSGLMHGCGEIIGGFFAMYMNGRSLLKLRLIPITCVYTTASYLIVGLGLPNSSVFTYTDDKPLIEMPVFCFLLASTFAGMADACLHVEAYNFVGNSHPVDCAPAFAVFKFIRNVAISTSFYYSSCLGLRIQTGILICFSLSTLTVYYWSWEAWSSKINYKAENKKLESVSKI